MKILEEYDLHLSYHGDFYQNFRGKAKTFDKLKSLLKSSPELTEVFIAYIKRVKPIYMSVFE